MSAAGNRRLTRSSTRAASTDPAPTPAAGPSRPTGAVFLDDNQTVLSTRSSRLKRNRLTNTVANSYGTNAPDTLTNITSFQATQAQAANNLSGALGQANARRQASSVAGLSDLDELSADESDMASNSYNAANNLPNATNDLQDALNSQFNTPAPSTHASGRARGGFFTKARRAVNWLLGRNRPEDTNGLAGNSIHNDDNTSRSLENITHTQPRIKMGKREAFLGGTFWLVLFIICMGTVYTGYHIVAFGNRVVVPHVGPALHRISDNIPFRHSAPSVPSASPASHPATTRPQPGSEEDIARQFRNVNNRAWHTERELLQLRHRLDSLEQLPEPMIDFFAPSNDAVIVPKLTSPEKKRKVTGFMSLFKKKVDFTKTQRIVGPFKDPKKMWCAPSDRGKAQITVHMGAPMAPKELVIHQALAYGEAIDVDTYPKEIELWVSIEDDEKREKVLAFMKDEIPTIISKTKSQEGRHLAKAQALPDTFIPIGRWDYNVLKNQARQNFEMLRRIEQFNISTTMASVRVNSNWGNTEATCLHQVSLYGEQTHGRKVYKKPVDGEIVHLFDYQYD